METIMNGCGHTITTITTIKNDLLEFGEIKTNLYNYIGKNNQK